jgi:hypothetical protein
MSKVDLITLLIVSGIGFLSRYFADVPFDVIPFVFGYCAGCLLIQGIQYIRGVRDLKL